MTPHCNFFNFWPSGACRLSGAAALKVAPHSNSSATNATLGHTLASGRAACPRIPAPTNDRWRPQQGEWVFLSYMQSSPGQSVLFKGGSEGIHHLDMDIPLVCRLSGIGQYAADVAVAQVWAWDYALTADQIRIIFDGTKDRYAAVATVLAASDTSVLKNVPAPLDVTGAYLHLSAARPAELEAEAEPEASFLLTSMSVASAQLRVEWRSADDDSQSVGGEYQIRVETNARAAD
jgi:hypothetical protein